jgi:hypothetical protein
MSILVSCGSTTISGHHKYKETTIMTNLKKWLHFGDNDSLPTNARPTFKHKRRTYTALLFSFTLAVGAVGGGVIGTAVTVHWRTPQTTQASMISTQPIAQVAQTNIEARSSRPLAR